MCRQSPPHLPGTPTKLPQTLVLPALPLPSCFFAPAALEAGSSGAADILIALPPSQVIGPPALKVSAHKVRLNYEHADSTDGYSPSIDWLRCCKARF